MVVLLGGTIGNYPTAARKAFLRQIVAGMSPDSSWSTVSSAPTSISTVSTTRQPGEHRFTDTAGDFAVSLSVLRE